MTSSVFLLPMAFDAAAIGVGAFVGAMARYQVGRCAAEQIAKDPQRLGQWSHWHTAGINIVGCFILGGLSQTPTAALPIISGLTPRTKLMLGVGFCGSFTTFSTYGVDVVNWISKGQNMMALQYIMVNNVGGILAAAGGMVLARKVFAAEKLLPSLSKSLSRTAAESKTGRATPAVLRTQITNPMRHEVANEPGRRP
jgi:CrcB protein